MKKLIVGALALSVVTTMSMGDDNFYIGAGTAMEMVDGMNGSSDTGVAIELKVGKTFEENFGIEGKITKTISASKVDAPTNRTGYYYPDVELDVLSYSLWGIYHYPLTNEITISPKIGFLKEDIKFELKNGDSIKRDDSGVAFGIDIKKHLPNSGFDIYAGIEHIEKNIDHLTFGIQKNF